MYVRLTRPPSGHQPNQPSNGFFLFIWWPHLPLPRFSSSPLPPKLRAPANIASSALHPNNTKTPSNSQPCSDRARRTNVVAVEEAEEDVRARHAHVPTRVEEAAGGCGEGGKASIFGDLWTDEWTRKDGSGRKEGCFPIPYLNLIKQTEIFPMLFCGTPLL